MPSLVLKRGRERRIKSGHPWIYAGEVFRWHGDILDGEIVDIRDHRERFLGRGYVNRNSRIVARVLTDQREEIDEGFFRRRIEEAVALRGRTARETDACRLVYSEGDFLPGLIVDRYGDCLVLQTPTLGMDTRKEDVADVLQELLKPAAIYERNDIGVRQHEGLDPQSGFLRGEMDPLVPIRENGLSFLVNVQSGQKTGFFLDQRENRAALRGWVEDGRVLDAFCYTGAFAVYAAASGARETIGLELSAEAVEMARLHAERNGFEDRCRFEVANAFDRLRTYDAAHERFDLVILDPPSFTRSKNSVEGASRGYKEINLRAMKILSPGGYLITCSCSYHVDRDLFLEIVVQAARDARRRIRLLESRGQAADHPILPAASETEYLKCLVLQVV